MKRIPRATYRLQFNQDFTFEQAREILDYLDELGISDLYTSPLFEAGPQSTHGYDTCSFGRLNSNLGGEDGFERLTANLKERGMDLLLDVVPNHMSATLSNPWWLDVLENGHDSAYAGYFDINWHPNNPELRNKVLLPVLEDDYQKVLANGKLRLMHQSGKFSIAYYDRNFPVNKKTLPSRAEQEPSATLSVFNGANGKPGGFEKLDQLIQQQSYRLAYWKTAAKEINYRRFFDVTEMAAVKMELPEVFRETHALIFKWLNTGRVAGLRIDHPDGLWDPKEYLERIRQRADHPPFVVVEKILSGDELLPKDWPVNGTTGYDYLNRANGLFVDGSNASAFDEIYRSFTGCGVEFGEIVYASRKMVLELSFAGELNALSSRLFEIASIEHSARDFTLTQLREAMAEIVASFPVYRTYISENSSEVSAQDRAVIRNAASEAKKRAGSRVGLPVIEFVERILSLEIGEELDEAKAKSVRAFAMKLQQLTGPAMAKGLEDTAFYRFNRLISLNEVGGDPGRFGITPAEFHQVNGTIAKAWPHAMLASSTHDTKRGEDVRARINVLSEMPAEWREVVARWSQLNADKKTQVGNAPAPDANDEYLLYQTLVGAWLVDGESPEGLKSFRERVEAFMLKAVKEAKTNTSWTEPNAAYEDALRQFVEGVLASEGNETFLQDVRRFATRVAFFGRSNSLAQTLLKITSPGVPDFYQGSELWNLNLVDPDNRRAVDYSFRRSLLSDLKERFANNNARKDHARPRAQQCEQSGRDSFFERSDSLLRDDKTGASKLFLIWRALNFRKAHCDVFDCGDCVPLSAVGEKSEHVCAFARVWNGRSIVCVVPRLVFGLMGGVESQPIGSEVWKKTALRLPQRRKAGVWRNILTNETITPTERDGAAVIEMSMILKSFPVAILTDL